MIEYLVVLTMGIAAGYVIGSSGSRYQRSRDLQALIDLESVQRKADGIYRRGDELTETEPLESWAGDAREVRR